MEPKRPEPAPPETMASKLKIDVNSSTPSTSRPGSSLSNPRPNATNTSGPNGSGSGAGAGTDWESFKGTGQTLNGRKTKGKGKSVRKIEEVDPDSKIYRTECVHVGVHALLTSPHLRVIHSKPRFATNDVIDQGKTVPAPLRLPHGKLFFGFPVVPYRPTEEGGDGESARASGSPNLGTSQVSSRPSFYIVASINQSTSPVAGFVLRCG